MRAISLFSGVGGLDLGFERAGIETVLQVEINEFCRRVLAKHWSGVRRIKDVRAVTEADVQGVDVVYGGFPCQPVSLAGKRLAQADERWLWPEFERVVRMARPRYVVVENVPGLLTAGMGDVLAGLSSLGFDAEWSVVSACSVGAPHMRKRVFIVAYSNSLGRWRLKEPDGPEKETRPSSAGWCDPHRQGVARERLWNSGRPSSLGMADGLPGWVERRKALGNAVVPQVAEVIGARLVAIESARLVEVDA
jgi:DNA (cytosine-5)-methyltransferase 1